MIDTNIKELLTMTRLIVPQMSHGFREIFSRFFVVNQLLPMSNVQKQQINDRDYDTGILFCCMALGGLRTDGGFRMSCLDVYRFDVPMPRNCGDKQGEKNKIKCFLPQALRRFG